MWSLLDRKYQLTIVLAAGFLFIRTYDVVMALRGAEPLSFWKSVTLGTTFVGVVLAFLANRYWRWLWKKCPGLQAWALPDLNGIWTGTLVSTWINPATGQGVPPIPTKITIRQGLFLTSVSLKTGESESHSKHVVFERMTDIHRFRIWYSYHNGPDFEHQHRSAPHEGVAYLDLDWDTDQNALKGHYYTARKTNGDITVSRTA
jgi:hypothetical protein